MSFAALSNDVLRADREFKERAGRYVDKDNLPDLPPLEELREIIKRIDGGSRGNLYASVLTTLGPMLQSAKVLPGGASSEDTRTGMISMLTNLGRGKRPVEREQILRWLYKLHRNVFDHYANSYLVIVPDELDDTPLYNAFLCWTGEYAHDICTEIRKFFDKRDERVSVFMSSHDVGTGQRWRQKIDVSLDKSASGLLIATQEIAHSDWIAHEFAVLSTKATPPEILLLDAPASMLPKPLLDFQHATFTIDNLVAWIERVFSEGGVDIYPGEILEFRAAIQSVIDKHKKRFVTAENSRWSDKFARATIMSKQERSPFDLEQTILSAQKHLILVAQNHWFMTMHEAGGSARFWPLIKAALLEGVQIDIVGMHPRIGPSGEKAKDVANAHEVWRYFMKSHDFYKHVKETWDVLAEWSIWYKDLKLEHPSVAKLGLYGAYFTPLTISLVDPESDDAYLVLSPRINDERSFERPQIILQRKFQPDAFRYYASATRNGIANAGWREMEPEQMLLDDPFVETGMIDQEPAA